MELREYVELLRRYAWLIVGLPVAFFVIGYVVTVNRPPNFEASTTLTVEKPQAVPQATSPFYQYDEYYSQLAAALFADTIANWLRSPGPVVEIYGQADLPPPSGSAAQVARTFRVSKGQEASVITLTVADRNRDNAAKLIEVAKSVVNAKVDELRARNSDQSYFTVAATPAEVFEFTINPYLTAILGAVTGLIIALVFGLLFASLAPRRQK
jgi:capsular polysaccharide biosynthesis protein